VIVSLEHYRVSLFWLNTTFQRHMQFHSQFTVTERNVHSNCDRDCKIKCIQRTEMRRFRSVYCPFRKDTSHCRMDDLHSKSELLMAVNISML
jgi:hypothetical protein